MYVFAISAMPAYTLLKAGIGQSRIVTQPCGGLAVFNGREHYEKVAALVDTGCIDRWTSIVSNL